MTRERGPGQDRKWYFLIGLSLGAVAAVATALVLVNRGNGQWSHFADNGKGEPYSRGTALSDTDFQVYRPYFDMPVGEGADYRWAREVTLPGDIRYYAEKDGEPVLTLKKGTRVTVLPPDKAAFDVDTVGYGLMCWPDYEKGWRYGQPFRTDGGAVEYMAGPAYYVKTSDLEETAKAYWREVVNSDPSVTVPAGVYVENTVELIDQTLYACGVFDSPEL